MTTTTNYRIGSLITYTNLVGKEVEVKVIRREEDVKNGRPGFDGITTDKHEDVVWGYDSQSVVKF